MALLLAFAAGLTKSGCRQFEYVNDFLAFVMAFRAASAESTLSVLLWRGFRQYVDVNGFLATFSSTRRERRKYADVDDLLAFAAGLTRHGFRQYADINDFLVFLYCWSYETRVHTIRGCKWITYLSLPVTFRATGGDSTRSKWCTCLLLPMAFRVAGAYCTWADGTGGSCGRPPRLA